MSARKSYARVRILGMLVPMMFAVPTVRSYVEGHMVWHMLVQFPILFLAGMCVATFVCRCETLMSLRDYNAHGVFGLTLVSATAATWMIPSLLDDAVLSSRVDLIKYAMWIFAGAVFSSSWQRASYATSAFFLGNIVWMMATVGLLFQTMDVRLCANYLVGDQILTGELLVTASLLIGLFGARSVLLRAICSSQEAALNVLPTSDPDLHALANPIN